MNINYTFKNKSISPKVEGYISIDLEPNDFIDLSEEDIKNKIQSILIKDVKSKLYNLDLEICIENDKDLDLFCQIIKEKNEENDKYIYLACESERGDSDWYGDFNYLSNPLSKYWACKKQCECYGMSGSSHGYGTAGIVVKTTEDFLNMMGWEEDMKYETTREEFLRYKK